MTSPVIDVSAWAGTPLSVQVGALLPVIADRERPTPLDTGVVEAADAVVTMGCGETCPYVPGRRYEDWPVDDPAGQDLDTVRRIVDDVDTRVRALLQDLGSSRARS